MNPTNFSYYLGLKGSLCKAGQLFVTRTTTLVSGWRDHFFRATITIHHGDWINTILGIVFAKTHPHDNTDTQYHHVVRAHLLPLCIVSPPSIRRRRRQKQQEKEADQHRRACSGLLEPDKSRSLPHQSLLSRIFLPCPGKWGSSRRRSWWHNITSRRSSAREPNWSRLIHWIEYGIRPRRSPWLLTRRCPRRSLPMVCTNHRYLRLLLPISLCPRLALHSRHVCDGI